ncbi:MAG: cyclic nucleotide-binding domain-containing protein [Gammaproteobacteria bacterium]|nr:cyclic nucleotide-binding domain-containing protein [Gammaproteobacteria bacterium]
MPPPLFGVTTLGAGHGFDPNSSTSGMIIWINRRGVIVDPPVNSVEQLWSLGVSPKLIDHVILTHCHADHDAGTMQKLLQEGKINLITTPTIFTSFVRKLSWLTGLDHHYLRQLVNFQPVTVGCAMDLLGGEFIFRYTLHSIPTLSIEVNAFGKGAVYSSDTMNDVTFIHDLYSRGIISRGRRDDLLAFPWDKDVVFHEAGVPPLHTPLAFLCELPLEVRQKMYLVHVSASSIPEGSGLRVAPTGLANTVRLDVGELPHSEAIELLDLLSTIELLRHLDLAAAREILRIARIEQYEDGDAVFRQGDPGDKFYIVKSGHVDIQIGGRTLTIFSYGDFFGEKGLFLDDPRSADAIARSPTQLVMIPRNEMLHFLKGRESYRLLQEVALQQNTHLRQLIEANSNLNDLTPTQKTRLMGMIEQEVTYPPGEELFAGGAFGDAVYLVSSGRIRCEEESGRVCQLESGELLGVRALHPHHRPDTSTVRLFAVETVGCYRLPVERFRRFLEHNPGLELRLWFNRY